MNENDNILLEQFFQQAAQQQIEDNGFSERVMQQLPDSSRVSLLSKYHLWTLFCVVAFVLFILLQGWSQLTSYVVLYLTNIEVFIRTFPTLLVPSTIDLSGWMPQASFGEMILSVLTLMVMSVIGLMRWAIQRVW